MLCHEHPQHQALKPMKSALLVGLGEKGGGGITNTQGVGPSPQINRYLSTPPSVAAKFTPLAQASGT